MTPIASNVQSAALSRMAAHYTVPELGARILEVLASIGKDVNALSADDLAAVDEFHVRGREATRELAGLVGIATNASVLDVGCGIGGTARYLAAEYGCLVTGVDATADYCSLANELSARVGLQSRTIFRHGDALDLPFHDASFDIVWTEHMQMNVADKERFYREAARVLRPGGQLAFHDIFAGSRHGLGFPVPWAATAEMSFLIPAQEARHILLGLGLQERAWVDSTVLSRQWFESALEHNKKLGPPPLGLHLVMGDSAQQKSANALAGLRNGQLATAHAVFEK